MFHSFDSVPFLYITFVIDNVSTAKILPWCAFFVHTTIILSELQISDRLPTGNGICFTFADDVFILHAARSILDTI